MPSRAEVVNALLSLTERRRYLEVGVDEGETFLAVVADEKVGVDPRVPPHLAGVVLSQTSDSYFASLPRDSRFDVVFLDGLHTADQTLRDLHNALDQLAPDGFVVIDDVLPTSYQAALPDWADTALVRAALGDPDHSWMGDVFKVVFYVAACLPGLHFRTIADNHGQAVLWRGSRRREPRDEWTLDRVARLDFVDLVRHRDVMEPRPFAEILEAARDRWRG